MVKKQQLNITDFVKKVYFVYFKLKLGDQDKVGAPHKVCKRCVEDLRNWSKGKIKNLRFGIPMMWREQKNHGDDDCYFCSCDVKGFNSKWKCSITYPNLPSAIRPVPHGPDVPVPTLPANLSDKEEATFQHLPEDEWSCSESVDDGKPKLFSQEELNDLVRDLDL